MFLCLLFDAVEIKWVSVFYRTICHRRVDTMMVSERSMQVPIKRGVYHFIPLCVTRLEVGNFLDYISRLALIALVANVAPKHRNTAAMWNVLPRMPYSRPGTSGDGMHYQLRITIYSAFRATATRTARISYSRWLRKNTQRVKNRNYRVESETWQSNFRYIFLETNDATVFFSFAEFRIFFFRKSF